METEKTPQQKMEEKLKELKIPHVSIRCFGSQILVTCLSYKAAQRWRMALNKFSSPRGEITETWLNTKEYLGQARFKKRRGYLIGAFV